MRSKFQFYHSMDNKNKVFSLFYDQQQSNLRKYYSRLFFAHGTAALLVVVAVVESFLCCMEHSTEEGEEDEVVSTGCLLLLLRTENTNSKGLTETHRTKWWSASPPTLQHSLLRRSKRTTVEAALAFT